VPVQLTAGADGSLLRPGDAGWDQGRTPWVINVVHDPAAVALVTTVQDVAATVRSAAACDLRVLAEGTGHGAKPVGSLADTVLLRTCALKMVDVDPATRSAWVGAGAEWGHVSAAAAEHGLIVQAGSAADVGVAGLLLSGGVSWLARSHGLAVNDILAVEMVDARGAIRFVDAAPDPDLFWAVRGGGGGLGVVTRFRLRLHTVPAIVAGTLFFPKSCPIIFAGRHWSPSRSFTRASWQSWPSWSPRSANSGLPLTPSL
jgi:FAD/FMN-containing dehydrogenase